MKATVIFRSSRFTAPLSEEQEPAPGLDCAAALMEALSRRGVFLPSARPIEGEGGWTVDLESEDGTNIALLVHWAPIGEPPEDYWVIQARERKGVLRSLFGKRDTPQQVSEICDVINDVLMSWEGLQKKKWLTDEEFSQVY